MVRGFYASVEMLVALKNVSSKNVDLYSDESHEVLFELHLLRQ